MRDGRGYQVNLNSINVKLHEEGEEIVLQDPIR